MSNLPKRPSVRIFTALSLVVPLSALAACSSSDTGPEIPGGLSSSGTGGTGAPAAGTGNTAANGGTGGSAAGPGAGGTGGAKSNPVIPTMPQAGSGGSSGMGNCGADSHEAMIKPLAIYMLVDQSASMTDTVDLWGPVTNAVRAFVNDPTSAGIEVALGYFPVNSEDLLFKCDATNYAAPSVDVGLLPTNTAPIVASLDAKPFPLNMGMIPNDRLSTPTSAAITGSAQYFSSWLAQHPDHLGVMVLATDGEPAGCDAQSLAMGMAVGRGTPEELTAAETAISMAAAGTPAIKTYVIGIGNLMTALNRLAAAGDTGRDAFIVDAMGGDNTQAEFLQAMQEIRGSALPCSFDIPTPTVGELEYDKVNVDFQADKNAMGSTVPFVKVENEAACADSANAWHYDDPEHPTSIELCPAACTAVRSSDTGNQLSVVSVSLGCETRVL